MKKYLTVTIVVIISLLVLVVIQFNQNYQEELRIESSILAQSKSLLQNVLFTIESDTLTKDISKGYGREFIFLSVLYGNVKDFHFLSRDLYNIGSYLTLNDVAYIKSDYASLSNLYKEFDKMFKEYPNKADMSKYFKLETTKELFLE